MAAHRTLMIKIKIKNLTFVLMLVKPPLFAVETTPEGNIKNLNKLIQIWKTSHHKFQWILIE